MSHLLPQVVRLSRPLLPAGRIVPMYSRQIPLTGGRHVRSVSRPAQPCPALPWLLAAWSLVAWSVYIIDC